MLDQAQIEDFKDRSREPMKTEEDSEMTTKHTPGPWLFRTVPTSAGLCHIVSAADWKGAFIYGDGIRKGTDDSLPKAQELAANALLIAAANPAAISELLDRLEESESDALEQARLNGMGSEREAALMAKLEAAEKTNREWLRANAPGGWIDNLRIENDAMRAKIERMERQEPVVWQTRTRPAWNDGTWGPWRKCSKEYAEDIKKTPSLHDWLYEARALYALPGAKGEEK